MFQKRTKLTLAESVLCDQCTPYIAHCSGGNHLCIIPGDLLTTVYSDITAGMSLQM